MTGGNTQKVQGKALLDIRCPFIGQIVMEHLLCAGTVQIFGEDCIPVLKDLIFLERRHAANSDDSYDDRVVSGVVSRNTGSYTTV